MRCFNYRQKGLVRIECNLLKKKEKEIGEESLASSSATPSEENAADRVPKRGAGQRLKECNIPYETKICKRDKTVLLKAIEKILRKVGHDHYMTAWISNCRLMNELVVIPTVSEIMDK